MHVQVEGNMSTVERAPPVGSNEGGRARQGHRGIVR